MRILIVTGPRDAEPRVWERVVKRALIDEIVDGPAILLHGDATGIDRIAAAATRGLRILAVPMAALWEDYGKPAGPLRNTDMVTVAKLITKYPANSARALVFHDDFGSARGTGDCATKCINAGIYTRLFRSDGSVTVLHNADVQAELMLDD